MAEILEVDRSTIVRWECAETEPQPWQRARIAAALNVTLDQLDELISDVTVANRRGAIMEDGADSSTPMAPRAELLAGLRTFLMSYLPGLTPQPSVSGLAELRRNVSRVHSLYQRASYSAAARLVPDVLSQATGLADRCSGLHRNSAFRLLAAGYVAASKIASKVGDGEPALLAADRAATAVRLTDDRALAAVAAYQAACAVLRLPGRIKEAESVTARTLERLAPGARTNDLDLLSAQGALLLLAALITAQEGRTQDANLHLTNAQGLAARLGVDRNRLWTGFGPTNVAIHSISAALRAGNTDRAIEIGVGLDTARLPVALVGRRAQVHLDLAAATGMTSHDGSLAVLHLLEAERVAPESVSANIQARTLLLDLLAKERRAVTPGLRPLAERAGLLV